MPTAQDQLTDMTWVPGGTFLMGSADFYPEERPVLSVSVGGFWIDEAPVTVAEYRRFIAATGYVTVAERPPDPADYPDADPALLVPGSLVFRRTGGPVDLRDFRNWWAYLPGADWRHPGGPRTSCRGRDEHPVTHVAYADAQAYAAWAEKELPTEAEWEYAARGGLDGAVYAWGDEFAPHGQMMANTWQGRFPWENLCTDGYEGTSPVGSFPANGYGLYDMTGNVWEWTSDRFSPRHVRAAAGGCCGPHSRHAGVSARQRLKVIKGGSHLCAPNYCLRYRPAARQSESIDTSTCHLGFRCVIREPAGR
ncbi:MAG TPA: formylglycine-generating enzyme family protein [Streptosporangiaceae bacterium]|nr:formylglycine-generating enzyme family protein [Streptosporangiaceae bacterium]